MPQAQELGVPSKFSFRYCLVDPEMRHRVMWTGCRGALEGRPEEAEEIRALLIDLGQTCGLVALWEA